MQNLSEVWDGSAREKTTGYWLVEIEARHLDGKRTGLYAAAWSQQARDFTSRNRIILEAVEKVSEVCDRRGVWSGDRGLDGEDIIALVGRAAGALCDSSARGSAHPTGSRRSPATVSAKWPLRLNSKVILMFGTAARMGSGSRNICAMVGWM
jgi:hypothetical protein